MHVALRRCVRIVRSRQVPHEALNTTTISRTESELQRLINRGTIQWTLMS